MVAGICQKRSAKIRQKQWQTQCHATIVSFGYFFEESGATLRYKQCGTFLLAVLVCVPAMAARDSSDIIGHVQHLTGTASIVRDSAVVAITAGAALYPGDVVRTGKPGAAGVVLTDDTTISLGSGSEIALNDYVFQPKDGKFALALKMVKGTFAYVTGQIVKLSPESAQVQTPDATIAVRGTKLLIQIEE